MLILTRRRSSREQSLLGGGIGNLLVDRVEHEATALGFTTLFAVSGARYREIGSPFWTRRYGPPFRVDADYWGPGLERWVWRHELAPAKN